MNHRQNQGASSKRSRPRIHAQFADKHFVPPQVVHIKGRRNRLRPPGRPSHATGQHLPIKSLIMSFLKILLILPDFSSWSDHAFTGSPPRNQASRASCRHPMQSRPLTINFTPAPCCRILGAAVHKLLNAVYHVHLGHTRCFKVCSVLTFTQAHMLQHLVGDLLTSILFSIITLPSLRKKSRS